MQEKIPLIILNVVKMMNNYLNNIIKVEIIDTEMIREYPDSFAPLGYLGVTILVSCNNKQHRVFLKYQQAEYILFYPGMIDGFMSEIVRDDLINIIKKYERKEKLNKIRES